MKRRILEKFKLTEISGVDRPCQEHATVAIMKRAVSAEEVKVTDLSARIAKLKEAAEALRPPVGIKSTEDITKFWSVAARAAALLARQRLSHAKGTLSLAATRRKKLTPFGRAMQAKARLRVAGAAGKTAAVGGVGYYLYNRNRKKD